MINTYIFKTTSDRIEIEAQNEQIAKLKFLDFLFENGYVTMIEVIKKGE
jgi:hypothetical protein